MARFASLAEAADKPESGVTYVTALQPPETYEIPSPLQHYSGSTPVGSNVWSDLFVAEQLGYSPGIDMYRIDDCLVTLNAAIFTMSNYIIRESLYPYVREHDVASAFNPELLFNPDLLFGPGGDPGAVRVTARRFSRIQETLFFAREHGEAGYFHWLHSVLPRVALYKSLGPSDRRISLAVSEQFQRESLACLGLNDSDILLASGMSQLCNSLYFCTPMVAPDLQRSGGFFERALFASAMLRKLSSNSSTSGRKIFISRKDAKIRRLVEEDQVMCILEKAGFESVILTGMPFKVQVALFAGSSVVVSTHGAGLSNVAFMREGGVVVELLTPDRLWPTFRGVSARSKLAYAPYIGNAVGATSDRDSDISVDADHFANFVLDAAGGVGHQQ